jgi:hypothetical protein
VQKIIVATALSVAACGNPSVSLEPSDSQIQNAYLETNDVSLGNEILSGGLKLTDFKKLNCKHSGDDVFRCKFYAKFGVNDSSGDRKIIHDVIGSQSGYFREAAFFQNAEGKWVCADVTDATSYEDGLQGEGANNER